MRTVRTDRWQNIRDFLASCPDVYLGTEVDSRRFIEAVLWINRTGAPWRNLPARFGPWRSVASRLSRWRKRGLWQTILRILHQEADAAGALDWDTHHIDGTTMRAHQHAAGGK